MAHSPHFFVGYKGEEIAARYLSTLGYKILGRNVRLAKDEIDIIAYDPIDRVIVFAEVKTRTILNDDFAPELNITFAKRRNLFRSARLWVAAKGFEQGWRIDVICIAGGKVTDHWKEITSDDQ
jgi:putative endonuclease